MKLNKRTIHSWFEEKPTRIPMFVVLSAILFVLLIGMACNQPGEDESLKQTQIAINDQATQLAQQQEQPEAQPVDPVVDLQATQNFQATQTAQAATQIALNVQETVVAQQATDLALTANAPTATFTETPTETPSLTPTETQEAPQEPPPAQDPPPEQQAGDFDTWMKSSKILLYEDMTKLFETRYVKDALDILGLSQNYTDIKDATGEFKTQLLSGIDWDLIIVAVEARTGIQGEFFGYILERLNKGSSVVMEHWNLDDLSGGQAAPLLSSCGIRISRDWWDPPNTARSLWPLYGEHPIWHEPNEGMSLANYTLYWAGDVGDFMKKSAGSDAILLAGNYAQTKDDYATLATCMDGRFILQTFSSHDYRQDDVTRLWQNYIYNALKARFAYQQ